MIKVIKFIILLALFVYTTLSIHTITPKQPDKCIEWIVWSEARGSSLEEMRAVWDVVEHRMRVRNLDSCAVMREPYQFSAYRKGMDINIDEKWLTTYWKVSMMQPVVKNAEYFHSGKRPKWTRKLTKVAKINDTTFYKEKQK